LSPLSPHTYRTSPLLESYRNALYAIDELRSSSIRFGDFQHERLSSCVVIIWVRD
jgi:hypothetical protein